MMSDPEAVQAAILLEAGSKLIEKLMSEKEALEKRVIEAQRKLYAVEKEKAAMAALLDQLQTSLQTREAALHISGAKIVELTEHNTKMVNALTAALTLLDYMLGELRNNNVVPSPALMVAKKRFDQQMKELIPDVKRMADPIPSPSELKK